MKILGVSDIIETDLVKPSVRKNFPGIDLILACGDLSPEYLMTLRELFSVPLYYIRGNHDIRHENKPPFGCIDIHNQLVRHGGLRILGLEGSRWYNGGPIQYREHEMRTLLKRLRPRLWISGGVDIVITHAPIRFINDGDDRCHRGFECFHKLIDRYQPLYFIHGHIHRHFPKPTDRITTVKKTHVINTYGYTLIEIDPQAI